MTRIKQRNPRQHYVPPSLLFSRKRQLLLRLIRLFQLLGVEVRISKLRCRNLDYDFSSYIPIAPNPPSYHTTLLPTFLYQKGEQTLEQDTLPDTANPASQPVTSNNKTETTPPLK